jgi:uncharacterized protein (DUF2336 family)
MTLTPQAVLAELDTTLPQATATWRRSALRQVLDLFLSGADYYSAEQVALFDAVMSRLLVPNFDRAFLAEMSEQLAALDNAPSSVVGTLARHLDPAVCGPILAKAKALPDNDIAEIADADRVDQNVLLRIAGRPELTEMVTDALLKRGNRAVQRAVIGNRGAHVSETGFARVIMGLNGDKEMAAAIAERDDVPPELRPWLVEAMNKDK